MVHGLSVEYCIFTIKWIRKGSTPEQFGHMLRGPPSRKDGGGAAVASHLLQKEEPREHVSQTPQNAEGDNLQRWIFSSPT